MRQDGLPGGGNKFSKIARYLLCRGFFRKAERQRLEQELHRPAAHHGVVAQNEQGRQDGEQPGPFPGRARGQQLHGAIRVPSAAAANHRLGKEDGKGDQQAGGDIDQNERGAAVLPQHIRESPDITQPHGTAGHGGNDGEPAAETLAFFHRIEAKMSARMPIGAT